MVGAGVLVIAALFLAGAGDVSAQGFEIDLEELSDLYPESFLDTVPKEDLHYLRIGTRGRVRNFLPPDFSRERTIEEYSIYAPLRLTFRLPNVSSFDFEEGRDGAFIVLTPRDLSAPELSIEIESLEHLSERRRSESLDAVWRQTVVTAINSQDASQQQKKGLLDISLPVQLPSAVEKIIGKGEATHIDISGRQSISFSGESRRVNPFIGVEGQTKQPLFPSLDLRQELDVRLDGQIGEKVNIQVDHSSSAAATEGNRIRLNYTGFEDDIIQLIEMGNTSLSLPGSQLVSLGGSQQGLFGIKGVAQVGPNKLTMVASKEEGEVSTATFQPRGGQIGQTEMRIINDADYIKNTFFFLDHPASRRVLNSDKIEVFQSVTAFEIQQDPTINARYGRAWVDFTGDGSSIRSALDSLAIGGPTPQTSLFRRLYYGPELDYEFVHDAADSIIGIELNRAVGEQQILAVRYVNTDGDTTGNYDNFTDTLALEIIKPRDAVPYGAYGYTWSYMMRHIYSLQLANIDAFTLTLEIKDLRPRLDQTVPEGSTVPWIRVFGLDQTDAVGTGPPDNRVDTNRNLLDLNNGRLMFPNGTPFNPSDGLVALYTDTAFAFTGNPIYEDSRRPEIYTAIPNEINSAPKFQIVVTAASTSRTFNINAFNITPGSESIRLDGRELQRDQDYRIDYDTGEVVLQGSVLDELTPSSSITVDYEFKPLFGGGSSSLVGFHDLLTLSDNATFGTTWLYESKSSTAIRPRLGEEPTRAVVGNLSGSLQFSPQAFTTLVNILPFVNTDARSSLSLQGEIATSFPDPNTLGRVYLDDFEGVEDSDLMTLSRRSWNPASLPVDPNNTTAVLPASKRLPTFWYNIEPERNGQKSGVTRRDLNPELDERESTLIQTLDIELDTLSTDSTYWAGVMAGFRGGGLDLSQGQFLEVWVNDFRGDDLLSRGGTLHIDLGSIDENFYKPEVQQVDIRFNTEDPNLDGFVALNEDIGLDGIANGIDGDDPKDDWDLNRLPVGDSDGRFLNINGTEGNGTFDSEDMDGTGSGEWDNAYFSFTIDLASQPVIDVRESFPNNPRFNEPPHANDSWRLYRIRLSEHQEITQDFAPSFQQIKHIRVWMDNVSEVFNPEFNRIQLAELKVVGNRWERDGIRNAAGELVPPDSLQGATFTVGVISTKTDPVDYIPPFRPNQENEIAEKEQSLLVAYDSLQAGQSFRLRKRFVGQGLDFSNYREAHLFVHTGQLDPSLEYFFQFAVDSLNYYEVSVPLTAAYFRVNNWMYASITLGDLTQLKLNPADSTGHIRDIIETDRVYDVRLAGNPSLFNVRFFYAGLRNKGTQMVSGELWLNDVSLGDRKRDTDFAERISGSLSMANVINLSGSFSHEGPDFRGLRQARGTGSDQTNYSFNAKTNVEYFVPLLGFSVPVGVSYVRSLLEPKYTPNSDTEIRQDALRSAYRTEQVSQGFSTTLTRAGSKTALMRYTFDKLKVNFSAAQSKSRTPSSADTALTMSGTADYSITWGSRRTMPLIRGIRFRYWLNSLNLRVNASRTTRSRYRNVGSALLRDPDFYGANAGAGLQSTYNPFSSVTSSFRMNVARDYARPHQVMGIEIGTETNRDHSFQANFKPPNVFLVGQFQPDFNLNTTYREDANPSVRLAGDPPGVKNVSSSRLTSVKMSFDLGKHLGRLFGAVGLEDKGEQPPLPGGQPPLPGGQPPGQEAEDAPADTTETAEPEGQGPDKMILFRKVGGVLSRIRRINASYNQNFSSNYPRIIKRPSFYYQFGLTDDSGVIVAGVALDTPERVSISSSFVLDSGVQITRNIDVAARFNHSNTLNTFRGTEARSYTTNWPDLSVSWMGLEKYGPLQGVFSNTSLTVGYRANTRKSGVGDRIDNVDKGRTITPALVFAWKNGLSTNVNLSLIKNTSEVSGSYNENNSMAINMELKYAFAAGRALKIPLPFIRNRTLRSSLMTSMAMGYTRAGGKRSAFGSGPLIDTPKRTTLRIAPRATYNFTSALNGGLFVDFQRSFSEQTNQTVTTTRVGIDATFTF